MELIISKPPKPDKLKWLIYGESGVGKTVFAASFPKPIFLDIDQGMASVTTFGLDVDRISIEHPDQFVAAIEYLRSDTEYETLVVDSLNELQRLLLRNVITEFAQKRPYGNLATQGDYGKMLNDFDWMFRETLSIDKTVVFISTNTDKDFEENIIEPALIGKNTAKYVAAKLDIIGFMYKVDAGEERKRERVIAFDLPTHVTKDRTGRLPAVLANPSYQILNQYLKGVQK